MGEGKTKGHFVYLIGGLKEPPFGKMILPATWRAAQRRREGKGVEGWKWWESEKAGVGAGRAAMDERELLHSKGT